MPKEQLVLIKMANTSSSEWNHSPKMFPAVHIRTKEDISWTRRTHNILSIRSCIASQVTVRVMLGTKYIPFLENK